MRRSYGPKALGARILLAFRSSMLKLVFYPSSGISAFQLFKAAGNILYISG
jgi:hypothetical protein